MTISLPAFCTSGWTRVAAIVLAMTLGVPSADAYSPRVRDKPYTDYSFVSETTLAAPGQGVYALCIEVEKSRLAMGYTVIGYVLAPNSCAPQTAVFGLLQGEHPDAIPLSPSQIAAYQAQGVVAADLPPVPKLPFWEAMRARFLIYVVGLGVIVSLLASVGRIIAARRSGPDHRPLASGLISAMWHVACADGEATDQDVGLIAKHVQAACGIAVDRARFRDMAQCSEIEAITGEFRALAKGLNMSQRQSVLRSAVAVAMSDGTVSRSEHRIIASLAQVFGLKNPVVTG